MALASSQQKRGSHLWWCQIQARTDRGALVQLAQLLALQLCLSAGNQSQAFHGM